MKFGDKIVLTSYGTLATGGKDYSIDEFTKLFYRDDFTVVNLSFDETEKRFKLEYADKAPEYVYSWNTTKVYIELSSFHKKLYEDGIIDSNLQKLFDLAEKVKYRNKEKRICSNVLNTGDLPTDKEELEIYGNYLGKELSETKTVIAKESVMLFSPIILGGVSYLLLKAAFGSDVFDAMTFLQVTGGVSSGMLGIVALVANSCDGLLGNLKKEIESYKKNKGKKEYVDKVMEGYDLVELSKAASVAKLNEEEQEKASKYQNMFLREIDKVKVSIKKLPDGERQIYAKLLSDILENYIEAVTPIFENNDKQISLGSASHVWEVNAQMLPKVYRLGAMVNEELTKIKEKNVNLEECQELQEELEELSGGLEYVDGWTDDLSLGSGGVAYAEKKVAK